jgi:hypothetical protein
VSYVSPAGRRTLLPLLLAALVRAQEPPPLLDPPPTDPGSTSALLQRLGARETTAEQGLLIYIDLHDRPLAVRLQRFDVLRKRCGDQLRGFEKLRERALKLFAKEVPKAQRAAGNRGDEAKVATLRSEAAAISAAADLSKERIHRDLDPRLQQLRDLVLVEPAKVLASDAETAEAFASLRAQLAELKGWYDLYQMAREDLEPDPAGKKHVDGAPLEAPLPSATLVDDDLAMLCLSALPLGEHDQKVLEANAALRPRMDPEEFLGTLELNRIRIALGLSVVRIDEKLGDAARDHSRDMEKLGFFAHESPVEGKRTPGARAARFGTSAGAENIAAGQETGLGAIRAWWYSPGHHKNMLGGHGRTGLGRSGNLWTQMFGG